MSIRLLVVALVAVAPLAARAADEENPYKKAKVGDFASYKIETKYGDMKFEGTAKQSVTAKDEKEATVKMVLNVNGMEVQAPEQKIDLSKPYDPAKGNLPPGSDVKVEKIKDGKEKIKAGGKEYQCRWDSYKISGTANGLEMSGEVKVWQSKDTPLPVVKLESNMTVGGKKVESTMELTDVGHKSD